MASLAKIGRDKLYNLQQMVAQIYPGSDVKHLELKGAVCND